METIGSGSILGGVQGRFSIKRRNAAVLMVLLAVGFVGMGVKLCQLSGVWSKQALEIREERRETIAPAPDPDAVGVIDRYVAEQKAWSAKDYRVEENRREKGQIVYWVIYLKDKERPAPGGGKSFVVYYDPVKREVVQELAFQ